jgi:hypothetical protein
MVRLLTHEIFNDSPLATKVMERFLMLHRIPGYRKNGRTFFVIYFKNCLFDFFIMFWCLTGKLDACSEILACTYPSDQLSNNRLLQVPNIKFII